MCVRQFKTIATANGWTNLEKAASVVVALQGTAMTVLQALPVSQQQNYEALVKQLDNLYGEQYGEELSAPEDFLQ